MLSMPACPTLFLRKQTSRACTWSTQLSFKPTSPDTEAGTVVWWNYFTYSSVGIRVSRTAPKQRILRFRPAGDGKEIEINLKSEGAEVKLVVDCDEVRYKFGFVELVDGESGKDGKEGELQWIGEVGTDIMTAGPLVGAPFTGMLLGVYAFGEFEGCLEPADFKYAEFR